MPAMRCPALQRQLVALGVEIYPAHGQAVIAREREPRRHVGIVLHPREHDLVAGTQAPPEGARDVEGDRRHVLSEHDLVGARRIQQVGHGDARFTHDLAGSDRGGEVAAQIRVRMQQARADALRDRHRHLCAGRIVEIQARAAGIGESGEAGTYGGQVEHRAAPCMSDAYWTKPSR